MRLKILRLIIIGLFLAITLDLVYVQMIRGQYFYRLSKNNRIRIVPLEGWRGRIKDRHGRVLADRRAAYHVMVAPQDIQDRQALFRFLSRILEIAPQEIERRYAEKKMAPFAPVVIAEDIRRDRAIVLEENKYRFPGLIVQEGFQRLYPFGKNSAHVLGYVGKVNRARREMFKEYGYSPRSVVGYSGVEEYYDRYLKGGEGGLQIEVDSRGRQVRLLSLKEPDKGQDITLTIDKDIQQIALESLGGARGVVIVMDTDNGEILALTSAPAFDPNVFVDSGQQKQLAGLFASPAAPLLNRAVKGLYPPGSVFKIPVAVGALDSRKITPQMSYLCKGFYELGGRTFRCVHVHGPQNLVASLAHSCNVYYYRAGLALGADMIYSYARQLGFGRLTHVDLPYEENGHIPSRRQRLLSGKKWYTGETLNLSIGQGDVLVTPLQVVRMAATVASNGVEVQPHVIKAIGDSAVRFHNIKKGVKIDRQALVEVQKGMRTAVTDYAGTAHVLDLEEFYVAGKTGTAQTSGDRESHAWFAGYARGGQKNIAFCVLLEYGGSSRNACLVARQLLLEMRRKEIL